MNSQVVGLAGAIGSGKSTIARELGNYLKCPVASFGAYVRAIAQKDGGKELARPQLQKIGERLISSLGPEELTRRVFGAASWDGHQSLVIDGVRHPDIITAIKAVVSPLPVKIVYLDISPTIRARRVVARDQLSRKELVAFDSHSTERDVPNKVKDLADFLISANGQIGETLSAVLRAINT